MTILLIILLTLIFSAFFSGSEIAFVTANKLKIEVDKNKGLFQGKILSSFTRIPSKFIGALLLGNNIALVIYGIAMATLLEPGLKKYLAPGFDSDIVVLLLQTIISTILILITAEFLPKTLFRINPNSILNVLALPLLIVYYLLYPVVFIFIGISEVILRVLFNIKMDRESYAFSVVDLDAYVREFTVEGESGGENTQEIQMFQNAIDFRKIKLRECMVPRTEIAALEEKESIETLRKNFISTGYSKILIFRETIDNIIGYTHAYDMFKQPEKITSVLKPISMYPESMLANTVLNNFIKDHRSVAVVVDEFGGTSGIVTMEDIIEEIFGEIADEYDNEDLIDEQLDEKRYLLSGRLEIDYLNEKYKLNLPENEDYETLAGLILNLSGSIPARQEKVYYRNLVFKVLEVTATKIELVQLSVND